MKIMKIRNNNLRLTNSGNLELIFIGAGSAFTKKNYQTNLLVVKGGDHLLIDCGTKCSQALHALGTPVTAIQNFLITHSHADHIGGLEEAALMGRYFARKKPVMIITEAYQHILWDMSLRGGLAYNEEDAGKMLTFNDFFQPLRPAELRGYPRETYSAEMGGIRLKLFRTMHIPDSSADWKSSFWSCGVIIDDRVLFTSDTRFDAELITRFDEIFKFQAIFHDCQFFTGGVHASMDELRSLPLKIRKKIILSHYPDNWEDFRGKAAKYKFAGFAKQHARYVF